MRLSSLDFSCDRWYIEVGYMFVSIYLLFIYNLFIYNQSFVEFQPLHA